MTPADRRAIARRVCERVELSVDITERPGRTTMFGPGTRVDIYSLRPPGRSPVRHYKGFRQGAVRFNRPLGRHYEGRGWRDRMVDDIVAALGGGA